MKISRRLVHLAAFVAVVAMLSGCAPEFDPGWRPPVWPQLALRFVDHVPVSLDPAVIALNPQRLRNDSVGVQARFSYLPGQGQAVDAFNSSVDELVRAAIIERSALTGVAYTPQVMPRGAGMASRGCVADSTRRPSAELLADAAYGPVGGRGTAVVCDIQTIAGPALAMELRVVSGGPEGVSSDVSTVLYVDTATGETVVGAGLWTDPATEVVTRAVIELLRRDASALSVRPVESATEAQLAAISAALAMAILDERGALTIRIAPGFDFDGPNYPGVAATAEPRYVEIPRDVAAGLLTQFGLRVQAYAGQPYTGPAAVAAGHEKVDCALVACVALTYDDGPSALTAGILNALAAHHSAATFFAMGENAAAFSGVLARTVAEGNQVENHTWNHPRLTTLSPARVSAQIRDTTRALSAATGQPVNVFRPPHGLHNRAVLSAAGMAAILWDIDTFDWQGPPDEVLLARAIDQPAPGSIVLMHDVQPVTARTASAVYEGLSDRGFTLVTLSQLFGGALPTEGIWRRGP
jgi:peptidoglycan-N-acetylglucosamine deacetylase